MVVALAPPRPRPVTWFRLVAPGAVIKVEQRTRSTGLVRYAVPAAVLYCAVFPVMTLGVIAEYGERSYGAVWALVATALYLPFHLYLAYRAARGQRPEHGLLALGIVTVVIAAATPMVGPYWLPIYEVVVVSAVIVLRPPWSFAAAGAVIVAQAPLVGALGSPIVSAESYYMLTVFWRSASVFVPLWLVGTIVQLQTTRRALAEDAVVRERLRIDDELRTTVGAALEGIADRAERADRLVGRDPEGLALELRALVDGSRRALADTRQMINDYQPPSLPVELTTAATLLTAAGIDTRVELPEQECPEVVDAELRASLRAATAELLSDDTTRACVITVSYDDGRVRLEVRAGEHARELDEAVAP
jgi:signal transduction histidine kinase